MGEDVDGQVVAVLDRVKAQIAANLGTTPEAALDRMDPARSGDEERRLLDEYDRATRHSYVTGGPEHMRAARAALLRALGVEA